MICPSDVSLPNVIRELLVTSINLMSKVSNLSTTLSRTTGILPLPSLAPALIVISNGLELKSTPNPVLNNRIIVLAV